MMECYTDLQLLFIIILMITAGVMLGYYLRKNFIEDNALTGKSEVEDDKS